MRYDWHRAAFFQGQIEQPVRSLTSLLTHEDIPVLVAVNSNGVYVIDDTESVSTHQESKELIPV